MTALPVVAPTRHHAVAATMIVIAVIATVTTTATAIGVTGVIVTALEARTIVTGA